MKVLILAGMLAAFSGLFFNAAKKDAETQEAYAPIIEAAEKYVLDSGAGVPEAYGFSYALGQENFGVPGYRIADLDGDGTDELLLGEGNVVYDLYTVSDGSLLHVLSGWERNRYYLCENGEIANESSSGAADSAWEYYAFDGLRLSLAEAVLYDGNRDPEHPWFYTDGQSLKQEVPISETQADAVRGSYPYEDPGFLPFVSP